MKLNKLVTATLMTAAVTLPQFAAADSELAFGGTGTTAEASLDFRIIIPDFVYFQVGSAGSTVDQIEYNLGTTEPGSGAFAATGGTTTVNGQVDVTLITNAADVSIGATGGDLTSGSDTIPFTDITAADTGTISVPDFGATVNVTPGSFSLSDTWSYSYDNNAVYNAGDYTGQVTYTVTTL